MSKVYLPLAFKMAIDYGKPNIWMDGGRIGGKSKGTYRK